MIKLVEIKNRKNKTLRGVLTLPDLEELSIKRRNMKNI